MHIKDKIELEYDGLVEHGPITIVAFGDSVTHGAVEIGEMDYESVYWNRLRKKLNAVRPYVPVNVINAGIGGITASKSIERLDKQVIAHMPDLVIVCFGLNDVNGELDEFVDALKTIIERCVASGADVIYMTPNMLNTYVDENTDKIYYDYAGVTAEYQNSGKMDRFMEAACKTAKAAGAQVCDCYAIWKELAKTQDTTALLANYINHPTREMHELFAENLFKTIFGEGFDVVSSSDSTMYRD